MGTEKCPFCGQEIDAEATRCFFCGAKLDEESVERRLEQLYLNEDGRLVRRVGSPLVPKVIAILILIYVVLFHGEPPGRRSPAFMSPLEPSVAHLSAKVTMAGKRLAISNSDSFDWENVNLEITCGPSGQPFVLNIPRISAGQECVVETGEFQQQDGTRFDPAMAGPRKLWIHCDTPEKRNGSYVAGLE